MPKQAPSPANPNSSIIIDGCSALSLAAAPSQIPPTSRRSSSFPSRLTRRINFIAFIDVSGLCLFVSPASHFGIVLIHMSCLLSSALKHRILFASLQILSMATSLLGILLPLGFLHFRRREVLIEKFYAIVAFIPALKTCYG